MYKILRKEKLNEQITLMEVHAPYVARKVEAGQFIILRVSDKDFLHYPVLLIVVKCIHTIKKSMGRGGGVWGPASETVSDERLHLSVNQVTVRT